MIIAVGLIISMRYPFNKVFQALALHYSTFSAKYLRIAEFTYNFAMSAWFTSDGMCLIVYPIVHRTIRDTSIIKHPSA